MQEDTRRIGEIRLAFFVFQIYSKRRNAMAEVGSETQTSEAVNEESATSQEVEQTQEQAAGEESATSEGAEATQTTEEKGSEPEKVEAQKEPAAVTELKRVRKRAQSAEQEAAYLRGKLDALQTGRTETQTPAAIPGKPVQSNFQTYEDFTEALTDWKLDQRDAARSQETEQRETDRSIQTIVEKGVKKYGEDFQDRLLDRSFQVSPAMRQAIDSSEASVDILHALMENPKESARIARLSPVLAGKEIAKLELSLAKPAAAPVKKISTAPEPVITVNGSASSHVKAWDDPLLSTEDRISVFRSMRKK
jgi:hypothetical protein